jgi:hypothetical protein
MSNKSDKQRIYAKTLIDDNGEPIGYRLLINLWSDGQISFNDELARADFDGDLVDSRLIEWEGGE